jgi:methionyl aminopeptidase
MSTDFNFPNSPNLSNLPNFPNLPKSLITRSGWTFNFPDDLIYDKNRFHIEQFDESLIFNKLSYDNADDSCESFKLICLREAAKIHSGARQIALNNLYPGNSYRLLVFEVENYIISQCTKISEVTDKHRKDYFSKGFINSGIAFPVGVNVNNVVAHDSSNSLDDRTFLYGDVVKIDIGVHVDGMIIDSAFTKIIDDYDVVDSNLLSGTAVYDPLINASHDSVMTAIKMSGPDQLLIEISESIEEIISSYEIDLGSDILEIKPISGMGGHDIKPYNIHAGKLILSSPDPDIQSNTRMDVNEVYAIETYATTGSGIATQNSGTVSHYMETHDSLVSSNKITKKDKKHFRTSDLYKWMKTRNGLPFSYSWITENCNIPKLQKYIKSGVESGQIMAYPPIYDIDSSRVSQFEHTIHIGEKIVEIFTLNDMY